ncbi:MAG: hypothetical protein JNJ92_03995 [Altererythrobacter sp.]|nr:hypothetical protein [Altererythrobacter sp.]
MPATKPRSMHDQCPGWIADLPMLRRRILDRFWERLRTSITWRGTGAVASERTLKLIISDAARMKREVERDRAGRS